MLTLNTTYIDQFLSTKNQELETKNKLLTAHASLQNKTCKGADYLGWIDLPEDMTDAKILEIQEYSETLREKSDVLIVCGIGGSYLGARAVIEAIPPTLYQGGNTTPEVVFLGNHLSGREYEKVFTKYQNKRVSACIISKSGTTMETAISYRLVRYFLLSKYSAEEVRERIVTITDEKKGALRSETERQGYKSYVLPDDIGGRYSVLTPVGLIPCAVAGIDIQKLVEGARGARVDIETETPFLKGDGNIAGTQGDLLGINPQSRTSTAPLKRSFHPAFTYAEKRVQLEQSGFVSELFITSEPSLFFLGEWWKQLMGESHGKEGKGLYPDTLSYTTDLHSLGQYVQEGRRLFFETMLWIGESSSTTKIPPYCEVPLSRGREQENTIRGFGDGLDTLVGRSLHELNLIALESTAKAHADGGCPSMMMTMKKLDAQHLGYFIYTMEYACALSGLMIGVNPFDQPGVEAYKGEMRVRLV